MPSQSSWRDDDDFRRRNCRIMPRWHTYCMDRGAAQNGATNYIASSNDVCKMRQVKPWQLGETETRPEKRGFARVTHSHSISLFSRAVFKQLEWLQFGMRKKEKTFVCRRDVMAHFCRHLVLLSSRRCSAFVLLPSSPVRSADEMR